MDFECGTFYLKDDMDRIGQPIEEVMIPDEQFPLALDAKEDANWSEYCNALNTSIHLIEEPHSTRAANLQDKFQNSLRP